MALQEERVTGAYPEGAALEKHVSRRKRTGSLWHGIFFVSTLVGIVALILLLGDVVDEAFGYAAIKETNDSQLLTLNYHKQKMLSMPGTLASEDDQVLVNGVAARPNAVGFFGYSFYQNNQDTLRSLPLDGVAPDAATVESGDYSLSRPLYIYSTQSIMENKRAVAAYINYYLNNVAASIEEIGYFPASAEAQQESFETWERATGLTQSTAENLFPATGDISVSGSSTVAPISRQMAENFQAAGGYTGNITVESVGTEAGFRKFCLDRTVDVVDASIAIPEVYSAACINAAMSPVTFQIGTDALPLVVSTKNTFVEALTLEQVQSIFTKATTWNEVDPAWPSDKIFRFVPGADSGTLDFFIEEVFGTNLYEQPVEVMNEILAANLSAGRMRALEAEKSMATRSQEEIGKILQTEVVKPKVVQTWGLFESIFRRNEVLAEAATFPAGTDLVFKSWLNWNFLTSPQSSNPLQAGINTAIWGSLWVTILAFFVAVPIGVMAAIYLEEYSDGKGRVSRIIETNINNLAGVPSIIYGMLGLAVFVRFLGEITSGVAFGVTDPATANGRTILSAGLTLGILILPLIIINSREALRAVPRAIREGAYGLGATRWQTTWSHVLPNALPGIMTGIILSVSRAFGETAPLIVVGVSTFIVVRPDSMFSKYTTLPAQIYQWTSRPQPEFQNLAAAAILALLLLLLALNATAILVRNHYAKRV